MAGGIQGLTPLSGISNNLIQNDPALPAETVQGNFVDPRHSLPGEQARPYPWQYTAWGTEPLSTTGTDYALVTDIGPAALPGGVGAQDPDYDATPYRTHAAPYPKNPFGDGSVGPDNTARQLAQSAIIHGTRTNAAARHQSATTLNPKQDHWVEYASVDPGSSLQPRNVPQPIGMTVGGWGSRDRYNSRAPQNQYGFDSAHLHRRVATDPMPLNYLWMAGKGRPMVRTLPGAMRLPIGPDSPFAGDNPQLAYGVGGAILTATPPDYVPPPQPDTTPAPGTVTGDPTTGAVWSVGDW